MSHTAGDKLKAAKSGVKTNKARIKFKVVVKGHFTFVSCFGLLFGKRTKNDYGHDNNSRLMTKEAVLLHS